MSGAVFYVGPSVLDGSPIVAIATTGSSNRKTGNMVQTWILRADRHPVEAVRSGEDAAVCGDCPHRGTTCYVTLAHAPSAVWNAWKRGSYPSATLADVVARHKRPVRMGAYGDPVAVPIDAWRGLGERWTGYTHAWRRPEAAPFRSLLMASCDSSSDFREARRAGWRCFVVDPVGKPWRLGRSKVIECPSARGVTCADCGLCAGMSTRTARAPSIRLEAHGSRAALVGAWPK